MLIVVIIVLIILTGLYLIYRYTFGADSKRLAADEEIPNVEKYRQYEEGIYRNIKEIWKTPSEKIEIKAQDGVRLVGKYYHNADGAPLVIMFHGYRSSAVRDGMGAFKVCRESGYNILMVDQRAHRESGGRSITFGVKERYDCLEWIRYMIGKCGEDTSIILIGLSMGATTVMMATGLDLPKNVKGVIADCGYSTPKDILRQVIKKMKLPVGLVYFFVRLSGLIFGGFDLESASAREALLLCKVPVLLIHGEADSFVPCEMSRTNYEACVSEKELFTVPGAEHGMSYLTDIDGYMEKFKGFLQRNFAR